MRQQPLFTLFHSLLFILTKLKTPEIAEEAHENIPVKQPAKHCQEMAPIRNCFLFQVSQNLKLKSAVCSKNLPNFVKQLI